MPVDLDWPAYAGKKNRLPWFLLAALLLAKNGARVLMHGGTEHTAGRQFIESALAALDLAPARSPDEASDHLATRNFAYLPLGAINPRLGELLTLKPIIGLRSPFHTVAKALNPFDADCQLIGVAHPPYRALHQQAALLLRQPRLAVFKGDGGEAERRPEKELEVASVQGLHLADEIWPSLLDAPALPHEDPGDLARLRAVWRGEVEDEIAASMVTGTVAVALRTMGRAASQIDAQSQAETLWPGRKAAFYK